MLVGDVVEPMAQYERMTPTAPQPFDTTVVWMFAGFDALATGDLDTAAKYARRGIEADPELAFSYWGSGSQLCLGAALVAAGDVDEGMAILDRAMPHYLGTGTRIFVALVHARVAQGLARAGRFDDAADALVRAYAATEVHGERWVEPIAMSVDAELRRLTGAPRDEVIDLFARAQDLATDQHAHAVARHIAELARH